MSDLIRRSDAIKAVCEWGAAEERNGNLTIAMASAKQDVADILSALPSAVCDDCIWHVCNYNKVDWDAPSAEAEHTDCTDFVHWLMEEVMDEEMWELNAVANGEIIARKLKKLGLLEVKDGYYVRTPSAEAEQGCDGCKYNTRKPQEQCLRCKRYWRDGYERKGGDNE